MSNYKTLLEEAQICIGNDEIAKVEKIIINETKQEEIRFSWWTQNGSRFQRAPLDIPENQWLELFEAGVEKDVFSKDFINDLTEIFMVLLMLFIILISVF